MKIKTLLETTEEIKVGDVVVWKDLPASSVITDDHQIVQAIDKNDVVYVTWLYGGPFDQINEHTLYEFRLLPKEEVIKSILMFLKKEEYSLASNAIRKLEQFGHKWPELATIKRSMNSIKGT